MIEIVKYNSCMQAQWDEAVKVSRNGTFMHHRAFMEYHSDRFADYSLMAMDGSKVLAVLPANRVDDKVYSHQGLTYGSWLVSAKCDAVTMMQVMEATVKYLKDDGVTKLIYKPVPHIYHRYPAEEDLYALFRHGAVLSECSISTTIDLDEPIKLDRGNRRAVNLAKRACVNISESDDYEGYWQVLQGVLQSRYDTRPVHTVEEMRLLQSRFPNNIKLYTATINGEIVAGVVMFYAGPVAHSQYIAAAPAGRENGALALLFDTLIKQSADEGYRYYDFGISCENHGQYLNEGLAQQKARLGGRGIAYNVYSIKL
ncbi:MAG: GNAT family N-acetyltransferase [Bacteroidales bacterium]|nr:GNAT family N-acetyltransferase [Candidatus Sodaliphilus fimicaballi]